MQTPCFSNLKRPSLTDKSWRQLLSYRGTKSCKSSTLGGYNAWVHTGPEQGHQSPLVDQDGATWITTGLLLVIPRSSWVRPLFETTVDSSRNSRWIPAMPERYFFMVLTCLATYILWSAHHLRNLASLETEVRTVVGLLADLTMEATSSGIP